MKPDTGHVGHPSMSDGNLLSANELEPHRTRTGGGGCTPKAQCRAATQLESSNPSRPMSDGHARCGRPCPYGRTAVIVPSVRSCPQTTGGRPQ